MTAIITLDRTTPSIGGPTLAVAAGRTLIAAGALFGTANLIQGLALGGVFGLHPAVLSVTWPVAVIGFFVILARLRRNGGEAARRAGAWSRIAIFSQIAAALSLAALSAIMRDWTLMMWMSPIGLGMYAAAWLIAGARAGRVWMAALGFGCLAVTVVVVRLVGTPAQYLAYALGLFAFALTPGLVLVLGGQRKDV